MINKIPIKHQDKVSIEKILRCVPIFKNLPEKRIKQLVDDFTVRNVSKGKTIMFQSDEGTDLYLVLNGRVRISILNEDGNEFVLTTLNEGDFFGEMSLIDGKPRSATVMVEEDVSLGILKREKFINAVKQDPMITFELLAALTERLRKADEMIKFLVFFDVRKRLLKLLEQFIKEEGKREEKGFYKIKKRTHKELAASIGASREAVSKILKGLISKKEIIGKNDYFLISPALFSEIE